MKFVLVTKLYSLNSKHILNLLKRFKLKTKPQKEERHQIKESMEKLDKKVDANVLTKRDHVVIL